MPEGLELFQYGIGGAIGLSFGWLFWRLPIRLRTRHTRKLRRIVMDLHRIEAAFVGRRNAPNQRELRVQRVPVRQRMSEWYTDWKADYPPRTPEQMAQEAFERELLEAT